MNDAFGKALRELARPTTPRELEARGVRRLRSIPLSQVARVFEIALDQTLGERRGELSEEERAELAESAEGRLRSLVLIPRRLTDAAESQRQAHAEPQASEVPTLDEDAARVSALLDRADAEPGELRSALEGAFERARERERRLERRVAKLLRSAEESEAALQSALDCFDPAHKYRSHAPRGVEQDDPRREQKLSMMEDVLRTNLGLQRG